MPNSKKQKVRYAVVGLGYISQIAVLPSFKNAPNSELSAFVSGDPAKLKQLGRRYGVKNLYSYEQYEKCLASGEIDAVYIALPNHLHREYTERAARYGIHVLCEKPLATTEADCRAMIDSCSAANVKLMTAYRLHFERANMQAVEIARSGKLGDIRFFNSSFSFQVKDENNIRLKEEGGGPLYDIGIYCINAARYLFRDEPFEVLCTSATNGEARFSQVDEMFAAVMKFPHDRIASFVASFGASPTSYYELVGTKGSLCLDSAYDYAVPISMELTVNEKTTTRKFARRDQFGPELEYFSECVLKDRQPEPSGLEGLADVRIIESLLESASKGRAVGVRPVLKPYPDLRQELSKPAIRRPSLVHAAGPEGKKAS